MGELVRQATLGDDAAALELARVQLPRVVTALRSLLDEHHPDGRGRCVTCRGARWWRRPPRPCRAYLGTHLRLLVPPTDTTTDAPVRCRVRVMPDPPAVRRPALS